MKKRGERVFPVVVGICVLFLVSIPYGLAAQKAGSGHVFGGFLLNPLDGNSYLAKMVQGMEGAWRFQLPFTGKPGDGAYLFLFYLGLGHVARLARLPAVVIFHLARLASSGLLLWALWDFWGQVFNRVSSRRLAFGLSALGSGSGWLLVAWGGFTSDFWVAEAYPFLSMYANPHFALGLAILLWILSPGHECDTGWKIMVGTACGGLLLGVINPFGVVVGIMVLGGNWLWHFVRRERGARENFMRMAVLGVVGMPSLIYALWVTSHDPAFRSWNAQNLTPSPAVWDLVVSLSPAVLVGVWGLVTWVGNSRRPGLAPDATLVSWLVLGITAIYLPLALQRRFMMGLFIPVTGLAVLGLENLFGSRLSRFRLAGWGLMILSLPTNLMILLAAYNGIQNLDPAIYMAQTEMDALVWIANHAEGGDIILASPEMGLFIPAYTGKRVLYGHPFETVDAARQEAMVIDFFRNGRQVEAVEAFVVEHDVGYVFLGPREDILGEVAIPEGWVLVYWEGDVRVYWVGEE